MADAAASAKQPASNSPGWDATTSAIIAQAELAETPELGMRNDAVGTHGIGRLDYKIIDGKVVYADSGPVRIMITEALVGPANEPNLGDLKQAMTGVYGTDFGVHSPTWISRFTDMTRQAVEYRDRRVLLAGDAAHVHSPDGAQGLQMGVQDAVNLGWKLAQVVDGTSPQSLLDTYHAERHPAAARVLRTTMAHVALRRPDERIAALRDTVAEFLKHDAPRKQFAAKMFGLDIRYDFGETHPLLGRRMPDLDLLTVHGTLRLSPCCTRRGPCCSTSANRGAFNGVSRPDRVQLIDADYNGDWQLPALGPIDAPGAVLIRPDGHVAWVGDRTQQGLAEALTTWFGSP